MNSIKDPEIRNKCDTIVEREFLGKPRMSEDELVETLDKIVRGSKVYSSQNRIKNSDRQI